MSQRSYGEYVISPEDPPSAGGMALVYKGKHRHLPLISAVKIPKPQFAELFSKEAKTTVLVSGHGSDTNHIVNVRGGNLEHDPPYLVLEWLPESLADILKEKKSLSWQEVVKIGSQICVALELAHTLRDPEYPNGIIHRDINPQNILVVNPEDHSNYHVKVSDFGLAAPFDTSGGVETRIVGKPHYAPQEQWPPKYTGVDNGVVPASDIYSLGITMFELLTGQLPFLAEDWETLAYQHKNKPIDYNLVTSTQNSVPSQLINVLQKATSKHYVDRYQSPGDMKKELDELISDSKSTGESVDVRSLTQLLNYLSNLKEMSTQERVSSSDDSLGYSHRIHLAALPPSLDMADSLVTDSDLISYDMSREEELRQQAELFVAQSRYKLADQCYTELLQINDEDHEIYAKRAQVRDALGDYKGCISDFGSAIYYASDDDKANYYLFRGVVHQAQEKAELALSDYSYCLTIRADLDAYRYKIQLCDWLGLFEEEIHTCSDAIRSFPAVELFYSSRAAASVILATRELDLGDPHSFTAIDRIELAIKDYTYLHDKNPYEVAWLTSRGDLQASLRLYDLAISDYDAAIDIDPDNTAYYYQLAELCIQDGQATRAIEVYTGLIARLATNEELSRCYWERSKLHLDLRQINYGIDDASEAIRLDPRNTGAFKTRADLYAFEDDKTLERREDLEHYIITTWPNDDIEARIQLANIHLSDKSYSQALDNLSRCIEIVPLSHDLYEQRANAYKLSGDNQSAINDYDNALRIVNELDSGGHADCDDSLYPFLWCKYTVLKGYTKQAAGDHLAAIVDFHDALARDPEVEMYIFDDLPGIYELLGDSLVALEQYEAGIQAYTNQILAGFSEDIFVKRALAYIHTEQIALAISDLNQIDKNALDDGYERIYSDDYPNLPVRYTVSRLIAEGGLSAVYLCRDETFNRDVAIRVAPGWFDDLGRSMELLRWEESIYRLLTPKEGRVSDHNLVSLLDSERSDSTGVPYNVLEYFPNRLSLVLESCRISGDRMEERVVFKIVSDIASALTWLHNHGIIHADVKPSNILLDDLMNAKLGNLLTAVYLGTSEEQPGGGLNAFTPMYAPPEQAQTVMMDPENNISLSAKTDVYGLGCILFEMLTGVPYRDYGATINIGNFTTENWFEPINMADRLTTVEDAEYRALLSKMLADDPDDRISAGEVESDISLIIGAIGVRSVDAISEFEKARSFARSLNLDNESAWRRYYFAQGRIENVPYRPDRVFFDQGWISWGDWLKG